ncbi:MAG: endoribonuclease MazF [Chthoniobacterales bacterium]
MAARYVPDRGDVVWIEFDPQAGHERAGHRPAVVLSPRSYNQKSGLALVCPVTSRIKGYPFEVQLTTDWAVKGAVLCDQMKSLDWSRAPQSSCAQASCRNSRRDSGESTRLASLILHRDPAAAPRQHDRGNTIRINALRPEGKCRMQSL